MIIQHRRGKTADWKIADILAEQPENIAVILKNGEFAIEELEDGSRYVRIGDGSGKFFDSPYIDARAEAVALEADAAIQRSVDDLHEEHENTKKSLNALIGHVADIVENYETVTNVDNKLSVITMGITALQEDFQNDSAAKATAISELSAKQANIESDLVDHKAANTERFDKFNKELLTLSEDFKSGVDSLLETVNEQKTAAKEALVANENAHEQISKTLNDLKAALEAADLALADAIAQLDTKDTAAIHGIQTELTSLKADLQQLISDSALHTEQLDTVSSNISQVSEELDSLTTNLSTAITELSAEISAVESAQQASAKVITDTMQQHVSDINKTLLELSDADKSLSSDISALTTNISEVRAEQVEATIKIADLALADSNLEAKIDAVENKIPAPMNVESESSELTSTSFVSGVRKDGDNIVVTRADLPVATNTTAGITSIGTEGGAASFEQANENAEEIVKIKAAISELETDVSPISGLTAWRSSLEVTDTQVTGQFLTAVSQADGKITVSRAQPLATDIAYGDSTLDAELANRKTSFNNFAAKSVQINEADRTLHIGDDLENSIIFYCGNATDL
jgi:chromosome segregation ATPase